jgi:hypothetical protein
MGFLPDDYVIPAPIVREASKRVQAGTHAPEGKRSRSPLAARDVRGAVEEQACSMRHGRLKSKLDVHGVPALSRSCPSRTRGAGMTLVEAAGDVPTADTNLVKPL